MKYRKLGVDIEPGCRARSYRFNARSERTNTGRQGEKRGYCRLGADRNTERRDILTLGGVTHHTHLLFETGTSVIGGQKKSWEIPEENMRAFLGNGLGRFW